MNRFAVKPEVYFGSGSVACLAKFAKERALVVTDPFMVESGAVNKVTALLEKKGTAVEIFSGVRPDPPVEIVAEGISVMMRVNPDLLIAFGGGSTIDAAKSILSFAGKLQGQKEQPLFVAIPTTSGTGSEVTSFSVITEGKRKIPIVDDGLIPDVAVIDCDFVRSVPPRLTADTGIDVLTHAIEAYVSTAASDYTDALAEKAIKIVFDYLLKAYNTGGDLLAREKMHNASCIAGMAFTNASLGINHSLAHALGGMFHIPHGRANAILLPYVISYNADLESKKVTTTAKRYAAIAELLGLKPSSAADGVNKLVCAIKVLLKEMEIPPTLKEAGIDKKEFLERVEEMAEAALADRCTETNPRRPDKNDLIKIYLQAYGE